MVTQVAKKKVLFIGVLGKCVRHALVRRLGQIYFWNNVEAASMSNPQASSPLLVYSHGHKIQAAFSQFTLCKLKK
jgi:hypothetical protein